MDELIHMGANIHISKRTYMRSLHKKADIEF